jgi:hypothetical protein
MASKRVGVQHPCDDTGRDASGRRGFDNGNTQFEAGPGNRDHADTNSPKTRSLTRRNAASA